MINLNPSVSTVQQKQSIYSNPSSLRQAPNKDIATLPRFGDKPEKSWFTRLTDKIKGWWHSVLIFLHLRSKTDKENTLAEGQPSENGSSSTTTMSAASQEKVTEKLSPEDLEQSLNEKETQQKKWANKLTLLSAEFQKQLIPIYLGKELNEENKQAIKEIAVQVSEFGQKLCENLAEQEKLIETLENEYQRNHTGKKYKLSFDKEKYGQCNASPEKVEEDMLHLVEKTPEIMAKINAAAEEFALMEDETELVAKQQKLGESLAAILKK